VGDAIRQPITVQIVEGGGYVPTTVFRDEW
jgi:hypothetical protein